MKAAHNIFYSGISTFFKYVINLIIFILLARYFSTEKFGIITLGLTFSLIVGVFADYGFSSLISRDISQKKYNVNKYYQNILVQKILLSIVITAIVMILLSIIDYPTINKKVAFIFSVAAILNSYVLFNCSFFRGLEEFQYETIVSILLNISLVVFCFIVFNFRKDIILIATCFALSGLLAMVFSFILLKIRKIITRKLLFDFELQKYLIKEGIHFGLHGFISITCLQLDTLFLSYFKGDVEVAYYQSAVRIIFGLLILMDIFRTAFLPVFSRHFVKGSISDIFKTTNKFFIIFAIPLFAIIYFSSEKIIYLIYGPKYANSIIILQYLSFLMLVQIFVTNYGLALTATDNQPAKVKSSIFALIVNVFLCIILIPKYGAIGAATSTIVTQIVLLLLYMYFYYLIHFGRSDFEEPSGCRLKTTT